MGWLIRQLLCSAVPFPVTVQCSAVPLQYCQYKLYVNTERIKHLVMRAVCSNDYEYSYSLGL